MTQEEAIMDQVLTDNAQAHGKPGFPITGIAWGPLGTP